MNILFIIFIITLTFKGFILPDNLPLTKSHHLQSGRNNDPLPYISQSTIYIDNFDGANDTISLKARGYKVWYRGSGPQGLAPTWFQGDSAIFHSFNGQGNGYVAANYNVVTGTNNIDSWLVFPRVSGGISAGDSLYFYSRSDSANSFPDSIRVMYSASDSVPEGGWTELGRFLVNISGSWQLKGFRSPSSSANGRFAIRYCVVNGGPTGQNSNYIGIDAASIVRNPTGISVNSEIIPSYYSLKQNYPNPFNPSTKINFSVPLFSHGGVPRMDRVVSLKIYDILGKEIAVLINKELKPGSYEATWNASNYPSGVYFYKLESAQFSDVKKMLLIK